MTYTEQNYITERALIDKAEAYRKSITQGKRNYLTAEECQHTDYASVTNEMRSRVETYEFLTEKPEKYFVYIKRTDYGELTNYSHSGKDGDKNVITTWTGEVLAKIIHVGRVYHSVFGDKRQSFRARALNGVLYWGTAYLSAGDYARIAKMKG